jgi:hypothetical protein
MARLPRSPICSQDKFNRIEVLLRHRTNCTTYLDYIGITRPSTPATRRQRPTTITLATLTNTY